MVTKRDIGNWILELQEKSKGTFNYRNSLRCENLSNSKCYFSAF